MTTPGMDVNAEVVDATLKKPDLIDNKWVILALLFLVLAGFGIPFLWKSKAFSKTGKILLTLVMIVYTAVILWLICVASMFLMEQLSELKSIFSG